MLQIAFGKRRSNAGEGFHFKPRAAARIDRRRIETVAASAANAWENRSFMPLTYGFSCKIRRQTNALDRIARILVR